MISAVLCQTGTVNYEKQLADQDKAINSLKSEITKTQQEIKTHEQKEKSTAEKLSSLEKCIEINFSNIEKISPLVIPNLLNDFYSDSHYV